MTPSFGQHEFSPATRSIFLGDGAAVQNDVDFEDISFFTITGKVTYKDTNVPVEGATLLIDGQASLGSDNKVVVTNENGDYEINVPIGDHYVSVEKDGHGFDEGIFPPLDENGNIALYTFSEDLTINFSDSTKVKVDGRVTGGIREAEKQVGFANSINNVGATTISFDLQNEAFAKPTATLRRPPC